MAVFVTFCQKKRPIEFTNSIGHTKPLSKITKPCSRKFATCGKILQEVCNFVKLFCNTYQVFKTW